jgi:hypothetical protein
MMEAEIIFRLLVIPAGLLIAYFSYRIHDLTEGGSAGWKYMAIAGLSFSLWAISQIAFKYLIDSAALRMSAASFFLLLMVIFAPLSPVFLARDMKLSGRARMITVKRYFLYIVPVSLVIIGYNLIEPYFITLSEVMSVSYLIFGFALLPMAYVLFCLWRETGNKSWFFVFAFAIIISLTVFLESYSGGCCGLDGYYYGNPLCGSYSADYVTVLPLACTAGILPVVMYLNVLQIAALLIGLAGFYLIWRPMNM